MGKMQEMFRNFSRNFRRIIKNIPIFLNLSAPLIFRFEKPIT